MDPLIRIGLPLCAAILIAPTVVAQTPPKTPQANLSDYLKIVVESPKSKGPGIPVKRVEIDSKLQLLWDERGLADHLAARYSVPSKGPSVDLAEELQALDMAADILTGAQTAELDYRIAFLETLGGAPVSKGQALQEAVTGLETFRKQAANQLLGSKGPGSKYAKDLAWTLSGETDEGFGALQEAVTDVAKMSAESLSAKVRNAPRMEFFMSAHLVHPTGQPFQIHLDKYDRLEGGKLKRFPRMRLALDARTLDELRTAQLTIDGIQRFRNTDLLSRSEDMNKAIRGALESFSDKLKIEAISEECDKLVQDLHDVTEEKAKPLLKDIRTLQALVRPFQRSKIVKAPTQAAGLTLFAEAMNGATRQLWTLVNEGPAVIEQLAKNIRAFILASPGVIREDAAAFFSGMAEDSRSQFTKLSGDVTKLSTAVTKASRALLLTEDFAFETKDLVPQLVDEETELDTTLDLQSIGRDRRPGDRIVVRAEVRRAGSDEQAGPVVESDTQTLYVEAYGGYIVSGGAVLLVDPRSTIPRRLNNEPTVGLGYHYHYGIRGSDYWNRILNPGLGVTFSMLDFNDDKRFELGAAVGMTLFNDAFWIGYGRNVHAGANYFYIGLNSSAITRLFRPR